MRIIPPMPTHRSFAWPFSLPGWLPQALGLPLCLAFGLLLACTDPVPDMPALPQRPAWDRTLPETSTLLDAQQKRGYQVLRGIIHLHSVYSHDACDNDPRPEGLPNPPCYQHLREGLCQTRQDFAMLTDHSAAMSSTPWAALFVQQPGDETVTEGVDQVGSRLRCDDATGAAGHRVLLTVGGENALMPVGLHRPVGSTDQERDANMTAETPEAIAKFHDAGALVLVAHGESHPLDLLRTLADGGLDGMEVYNLHANIDPKIRGPYLGLSPFGAIEGIAPWLFGPTVDAGGPEPDLALLGFLEENANQIGKFDTLLGDGHHLAAMMGSDIHENTVKQLFTDGERGDSYRRLMRWFGNRLLVPSAASPVTPAALHEALHQGRSYGVFEIFGSPAGFDFYATGPTTVAELGDTTGPTATLHLAAPQFTIAKEAAVADATPILRLRILHIPPGATAGVEVATRTVTAAQVQAGAELTFAAPSLPSGAYRAEVRITPAHLLPLLGDSAQKYNHEYPFIYSSPIYVGLTQ